MTTALKLAGIVLDWADQNYLLLAVMVVVGAAFGIPYLIELGVC